MVPWILQIYWILLCPSNPFQPPISDPFLTSPPTISPSSPLQIPLQAPPTTFSTPLWKSIFPLPLKHHLHPSQQPLSLLLHLTFNELHQYHSSLFYQPNIFRPYIKHSTAIIALPSNAIIALPSNANTEAYLFSPILSSLVSPHHMEDEWYDFFPPSFAVSFNPTMHLVALAPWFIDLGLSIKAIPTKNHPHRLSTKKKEAWENYGI